jgi:Uma2 family endonuclease
MVTYRIALGPDLDWLPDDTEESLLGTTVHQGVIVTLDTGLNLYKRRARLPWLIGNQLKLVIPRRGGGSYLPSPDILVHPTLGDAQISSIAVVRDGPPALAIEVTSPATARAHDLDTLNPRAKPRAYEECGIPEYLVFDPLGDFIPEQIPPPAAGTARSASRSSPRASACASTPRTVT